jgi:hypothetical protein
VALALARLHARISRVRIDFMHKWAARLANNHEAEAMQPVAAHQS